MSKSRALRSSLVLLILISVLSNANDPHLLAATSVDFMLQLPWDLGGVDHVVLCGYECATHTNGGPGRSQDENAVDFDLAIGDNVRAVADGVVKYEGWMQPAEPDSVGYGYLVYISHTGDAAGYESLYAHLSSRPVDERFVPGTPVNQGDVIGTAGDTGDPGDPHLHFSLYQGSSLSLNDNYSGPYDGYNVVPEPFVGQESYTSIETGNTLYSKGAVTLDFTARLQFAPSNDQDAQVEIIVCPASFSPPCPRRLFETIVTTDNDGNYSGLTLTGISPGYYNLFAKPISHLRWGAYYVSLSEGANYVDFSDNGNDPFLAGDVDPSGQDNTINEMDMSRIVDAWYSNDPVLDLNRDGEVNGLEFSVLVMNYARRGSGWLGSGPFPVQSFAKSLTPVQQTASMYLDAGGTGYYQVGDTFDVITWVDGDSIALNGAGIILKYDPCALQVQDADPDTPGIQVTTGFVFDYYKTNEVDPVAGTIELSAYNSEDPTIIDEPRIFAIPRFSVVASTSSGQSLLELDYAPNASFDSNAVQDGSSLDILSPPTPAVIGLSGLPQHDSPSGVVISPVAGSFINSAWSNRIPVEVAVGEICGTQVNWVSVEVSGPATSGWREVGYDVDGSDGWIVDWDISEQPDGHYDMRAYVSDPVDNGSYTVLDQGIILDREPPTFVETVFTPTSPSCAEEVSVQIEAQDTTSGVDHVDVWVNTAPDGSTNGEWQLVGVAEGELGTVQWDTTSLFSGTYRFIFNTVDQAGNINLWNSSGQPVISYELADVPSSPPLPSLPTDGSSTCDTTPTFTWSRIIGAESYQLQVDNNSDFTSPEVSITASGTSYTSGSALVPDTYYWRVSALTDCGSTPWSSSLSLMITQCDFHVYLPVVLLGY